MIDPSIMEDELIEGEPQMFGTRGSDKDLTQTTWYYE